MADSVKSEIRALMREKDAIEREIAERMARLEAPGQPGMDAPLIDREGFPRADIDVHAVRVDRNRVICLTNDHKALMGRIERLMHELHATARCAPPLRQPPGGGRGPQGGGAAAAAPRDQNGAANGAPAAAAAAANGGGAPAPPAAAPAPQQPPPAAAAAAAAAATTAAAGTAAAAAPRPFAVVDDVSDDSPASEAGIRLGDQLCRFGDVSVAGAGAAGDELSRVAAALQASQGREVEAVFLRAGAPVALRLTPRTWAGRGLLGCHLRPLGQR